MASAVGALILFAFTTGTLAAIGELGQQIKTRLEDPGALSAEGVTVDRDTLVFVYQGRNYQPLWAERPQMSAALVRALGDAGRNGIDPNSLGIGALRAALVDPALSPASQDLVLTDRFLTYARILAQGRVAPDTIERDWALPRPDFDPRAVIARLDATADPEATLAALEPRSLAYRELVAALQRYRALAAGGGWPSLPIGAKIEPGDKGPLVQSLRRRLAAEGDLPAGLPANEVYDAGLIAAVQSFQARHGLEADGRVGHATVAALNVNAADRVAQIELNLERWREMPREWSTTSIVVNTASALLTFYRDDAPTLTSRVIVGDVRHPTPVFSARVESVLFNPPWDVPTSILRKEIQPKLARDPGYLERNHMRVIGGDGNGNGYGWRVQQDPGPWNLLGLMKLELPNQFDVYLHDTPMRSLFAKPVRALSHGCIRVEEVKPLVSALLGKSWPVEAIDQVINDGQTRRVPLGMETPVYILYFTAYVEFGGAVQFRDDLYGRDGRLAAALSRLDVNHSIASLVDISDPIGCPSG